MNRRQICSWIIGLAAVLPAGAMAAQAYTTTAVNLRAGPDTEYPLVRWVPEGTAVEVYGCLADYRWCDVEVYGDRGWMSASYLVYPYQNSAVPVVTYGAVIGLPLIGFTFDSYWHDHYRGRPWYDNRQRWAYRHRPEYYPPHYESPRYSRPPPPQYRPPPQRPPQYHPPAARPPEFRPPQAQRPPLQQRPDIRPPQPGYRPPPQQSRPPSARPPEPARPPQVRGPAGPQTPQFERRMPSGRPSSGPTNEAGMTTGAF